MTFKGPLRLLSALQDRNRIGTDRSSGISAIFHISGEYVVVKLLCICQEQPKVPQNSYLISLYSIFCSLVSWCLKNYLKNTKKILPLRAPHSGNLRRRLNCTHNALLRRKLKKAHAPSLLHSCAIQTVMGRDIFSFGFIADLKNRSIPSPFQKDFRF